MGTAAYCNRIHSVRDKIWILNVGDIKMLETPLEYFMNLAYDSDRWPRDSLLAYLTEWAEREFALTEDSKEIAEIVATYSVSIRQSNANKSNANER